MVIKDNKWIGTHRGDMVVQDPSCDKIIMVMMFLGFVSYFPATLSS
jgi:hypothetical protein